MYLLFDNIPLPIPHYIAKLTLTKCEHEFYLPNSFGSLSSSALIGESSMVIDTVTYSWPWTEIKRLQNTQPSGHPTLLPNPPELCKRGCRNSVKLKILEDYKERVFFNIVE